MVTSQELVKDLSGAVRQALAKHDFVTTDLHIEATKRFERRATSVVIVFNLEGV